MQNVGGETCWEMACSKAKKYWKFKTRMGLSGVIGIKALRM
jgi:hypothetical protein